jgi:hypothetical protein
MSDNETKINPETGTKYSRKELKAAFERIENPTNWKLPIRGVMIPEADRDITNEAVIFFAGCVPTFRKPSRRGFEGQLIVDAVGYYAAVGA